MLTPVLLLRSSRIWCLSYCNGFCVHTAHCRCSCCIYVRCSFDVV